MQKYLAILTDLSAAGMLAAALSIVLVSSLWYSHLLFGKAWMRLSGIRFNDFSRADTKRGYVLGSIVALMQAALLGMIVEHMQSHWGAIIGSIGLLWLFLLLEGSQSFIWEKKPFALFLLHAFRALAALLFAAFVYSFVRTL